MDHEQLIARLEQRHASKRELTTRIPLGVQAEPLWQEILMRRKAKATMLPLHNAVGEPYWYLTTDAMIASSEKIIEALYENDSEIGAAAADGEDMPHGNLSNIKEIFFTSYVEGSPMTLTDAMNFLQSGEPPRDIEEQIIVNNRMAALYAEKNMSGTIDSAFLQQLNSILTNGLDDGGSEYRKVHWARLPYVGQEPYRVPPSSVLPDRVKEFIAFVNNTGDGTHPLVRAAIAQAWVLLNRPFQEGNERLGRLLSSLLLLRADYQIFNGVSFSALIARRTYTYYNALANVLREENGGDMTYFVEYYLDLLARALTTEKAEVTTDATPAAEWGLPRMAAGAEEQSLPPFEGEKPPAPAETMTFDEFKTMVATTAKNGKIAKLSNINYTDEEWLHIAENYDKFYQALPVRKHAGRLEPMWQAIGLLIQQRAAVFSPNVVEFAGLTLCGRKCEASAGALAYMEAQGLAGHAISAASPERIIYYLKLPGAETLRCLDHCTRLPRAVKVNASGVRARHESGELLCDEPRVIPQFVKDLFLQHCVDDDSNPLFRLCARAILDHAQRGVYEISAAEITNANIRDQTKKIMCASCIRDLLCFGIISKTKENAVYHIDVQAPQNAAQAGSRTSSTDAA